MNCTKAQDMFSSYMEHTMDPSMRMEFEEHLDTCMTCSKAYSKFKAAIVMVEELPEVEVPAGFHTAVMARVEQAQRATPHKVKWWNLDWGTVFTVRVPARAVAMGFAALLLMAIVVQLTPLHTITAGLMPWQQADEEMTQSIDENAVQPWGPWGQAVYQPDSGLSVSVAADSLSAGQKMYAIKLRSASEKRVGFNVYLISKGDSESACDITTSKGKAVYSDFAVMGRESVVRVDVSGEEGRKCSAVAKVVWNYGGRNYSEYVFMPSHFDSKAAGKSLNLSFKDVTTYELLSKISAKYGVIILASGDLSKLFTSFDVKDGTPADVLYKTGFEWEILSSSVYTLQSQQ